MRSCGPPAQRSPCGTPNGSIVAAGSCPESGIAVDDRLLGCGLWALVRGCGVAGLMLYSSQIGKVRVSDRLLDTLRLPGVEDVLDLGCGSGLMLLGAAARAPAGTATGIDLWR